MEKTNPEIQKIDDFKVFMEPAVPKPTPSQPARAAPVPENKRKPRRQLRQHTVQIEESKLDENRLPANYSGFAWMSILCFFPIGIAAVLQSRKVDQEISKGNFKNAQERASNTKFLIGAAIALGLLKFCTILAFVLDKHA